MWSDKERLELNKTLKSYEKALKIMAAKIEVLNDSYEDKGVPNPIEHIKYRLKSPESIYKKMVIKNLPTTTQAVMENINDIAGVRIICSFAKDVYKIAESIKSQPDLKFIKERDYIKSPKPSGYKSYHVVVELPVYEVDEVERLNVEVQIRTAAMDFWASLEHKVKYKYSGEVPKNLMKELKACADKAEELDERMYLIHEIIHLLD